MMRSIDTPNADSARTPNNRILIGSSDPAADVARLLPATDARDADDRLLRRKNSVLAIEVLLTASPEWWATATKKQQKEWLASSVRWLRDEYGEANIAHLQLHQDETSPHLTGMIVPIDPDTGHLNARRWIGGRFRCSQQQTTYAESVAHLGLKRGIEGSTAKHEDVSRHYGQINTPIEPIEIDPPALRDMLDRDAYTSKTKQQVATAVAPIAARAKVAASDRTAAKAAKATATKMKGRAERAEASLEAVKGVADTMRALPLPDVLKALGYAPDKADATKWKAEGSTITVNGQKWFDHEAGKGRGGAIDLACHVMDVDFKAGLAWLAAGFGEGAASADLTARMAEQARQEVAAAIKEREPFTAPQPVEVNWPGVRKWLVEVRKLPSAYVDELHKRGDIYADDRRNAVFIARDADGRITGAELKGSSGNFAGMAKGSHKAAGAFKLGSLKAKVIYLVESAIDAISLYALRRRQGETDLAVVSAAGTAYVPPLVVEHQISPEAVKLCAYDADAPGDKAAKSIARHGWERFRPEAAKDWNDELRKPKTVESPSRAVSDKTPDQDASPLSFPSR